MVLGKRGVGGFGEVVRDQIIGDFYFKSNEKLLNGFQWRSGQVCIWKDLFCQQLENELRRDENGSRKIMQDVIIQFSLEIMVIRILDVVVVMDKQMIVSCMLEVGLFWLIGELDLGSL